MIGAALGAQECVRCNGDGTAYDEHTRTHAAKCRACNGTGHRQHSEPVAAQGSMPWLGALGALVSAAGSRHLSEEDQHRAVSKAHTELFDILRGAALRATPKPEAAECETCGDSGWLGGPSYSQPDEGGVSCPDCDKPEAAGALAGEGGKAGHANAGDPCPVCPAYLNPRPKLVGVFVPYDNVTRLHCEKCGAGSYGLVGRG